MRGWETSASGRREVLRWLVLTAAVLLITFGIATGSFGATPTSDDTPPGPVGDGGLVDSVAEVPVPGEDPAAGQRAAAVQSGEALVGLFRLAPGACSDSGAPTGTYFRMVQPGGSADGGPYVGNGDSPCDDNTYTPLEPGTDGGLSTEGFQPHPDPAFDGGGGGVAERITMPTQFFGNGFAVASESPDRQTGEDTEVPAVFHDGSGGLSGQISAFGVAYNTQFYNQGAPKPDGSTPGITTDGVSGTYDPATGAFTLEWVSTIEGGAFNNFSGVWHLEGTFEGASTEGDDGGDADADAGAGDTPTDDDDSADTAPSDDTDATTEPDTQVEAQRQDEMPDTGPSLPAGFGLALVAGAGLLRTLRRRTGLA